MRNRAAPPVRVDGEKLRDRLNRRGLTLADAAYAVGAPYRKAQFRPVGGEIDPVTLYRLSRLPRCRMGDLVPVDWRDAVPDKFPADKKRRIPYG